MREIKFRAWDGEQMFYQDENTSSAMRGLAQFAERVGAVLGMTPYVMQFTGLYSKSGQPIYEGDVVKIHSLNGIRNDFEAEIIWNEKELSWSFNEGIGWKRPSESIWPWIVDCEIEVIGNVWENPELIK